MIPRYSIFLTLFLLFSKANATPPYSNLDEERRTPLTSQSSFHNYPSEQVKNICIKNCISHFMDEGVYLLTATLTFTGSLLEHFQVYDLSDYAFMAGGFCFILKALQYSLKKWQLCPSRESTSYPIEQVV